MFRAVPGCSGGVPGCSGCVPGFTDTRSSEVWPLVICFLIRIASSSRAASSRDTSPKIIL